MTIPSANPDAKGALVPHGIGGHARGLLEAAAVRLGAEPVAEVVAGTENFGAVQFAGPIPPKGTKLYTHAVSPAPASDEPTEAQAVCFEAYQVVGSLLSDLGKFETPEAEKILDNLSAARLVHDDVLPWESYADARKDTWQYATQCAISHLDYECGAPEPVKDALRTLRDAILGAVSPAPVGEGWQAIRASLWAKAQREQGGDDGDHYLTGYSDALGDVESALGGSAPRVEAMSETARDKVLQALHAAANGLEWYRDRCPDAVDGSDGEADELIGEAIELLGETAKGDAK